MAVRASYRFVYHRHLLLFGGRGVVVGVYDELSDPNLGSGSGGRALAVSSEREVWVVVFLPDNNSGQMANNNVRFLTIAQRRRRDDTNFAILRLVSTDTKCGCEFGARL